MKYWLFVCLACLAIPGILSAGLLDAGQLKEKVLAVSMKNGDAYTQGRKALEAAYSGNENLYAELIQKNEDWRVTILCEIVKERITNSKDVEVFIGSHIKMPDTREQGAQILKAGDDISKIAVKVPMTLVEKLWKGNEFGDWSSRAEDVYASIIVAIGELKIKAVCPLLEDIIINDSYFSNRVDIFKPASHPELAIRLIRSCAADALGELCDPKSVPALSNLLEKTVDDLHDRTKGHARRALVKCADMNSIEYLQKKKVESQSELFKKAMSDTISAIEKKQK